MFYARVQWYYEHADTNNKRVFDTLVFRTRV